MNADELIKQNLLMEPQIVFINYNGRKTMARPLHTREHYSHYYNNTIVGHDERNNIICQLAERHKDLQTLILVKTVDHGNYLSGKLNVKYINGSMDLKEREQLLQDFKDKTVKTLIATLSIFQQGLNIPSLEIIINAAANKSDISSIQSLGRLLRMSSGKVGCIYYDFFDKQYLFLKTSKKRINVFKDEGHEINFIDWK
jgi:superfamily II DNA or RNA helicase